MLDGGKKLGKQNSRDELRKRERERDRQRQIEDARENERPGETGKAKRSEAGKGYRS